MTLLFTGFEPFGGDAFNPSGAIARSLDGWLLPGGLRIHARTLPVSGPSAWRKLSGTIRQLQPRWIVATGVSGRDGLCIESTAWNQADYRIPDNAGHQPRDSAIFTRGPSRLETPLANRLCASSATATGAAHSLPVRLSQDPGRYVCNYPKNMS